VGTSTTTFLVDTNNPTGYAQVLEEKVNGALVRTYAYGTGLLSEGQFSGGAWKTSYYAFDGHGNVRFLSDATGTATDFYTYDAFGNLIQKSGSTANAYLYCGEQYDSDLGMYDLRARYMEPGRGRFWSQDNYEGKISDPESLHRYLYCAGDPVLMFDRNGQFSLAEVAVGAAVSGAIDAIAVPVVKNTITRVYIDLGFDPYAPYSFSSLGVDDEAEELLSDFGMSDADLSPNLFLQASIDLSSQAIVSSGIAIGAVLLSSNFSVEPPAQYHANDLRSTKPAIGYTLRDRSTGNILKYGETTQGIKRYTQKYMRAIDAEMVFEAEGSKAEMHSWQHDRIMDFKAANGGKRPPFNKNDY
jgi:RHS repeat-associated protein